jgi:hypothetical protein
MFAPQACVDRLATATLIIRRMFEPPAPRRAPKSDVPSSLNIPSGGVIVATISPMPP